MSGHRAALLPAILFPPVARTSCASPALTSCADLVTAPCHPPSCMPYAVQELVGPENVQEVAAAARDAGRPIGVHIYLFRHYGDPWGWEPGSAVELQARCSARAVAGFCRSPLLLRGWVLPRVTAGMPP